MSASEERSLKRFNGEDDDPGKQLKRWMAWSKAKMFTMKDLSESQKGPWLFTLLDGKALEAVEHVPFEDLKKGTGAELIWKALQKRFPEKEAHDQMGEALGEVFGLCAVDGESSQQWTARVQEVFLKCQRKAMVSFPAEAQGWIALNCCGFSDEQKAIIKAKAQGSLDIEQISSSMRSCFPTYKASNRSRKPLSAFAVDELPPDVPEPHGSDEFQDVEAFLADHDQKTDDQEEVPEQDAAEALAITWKERRKEIGQLQRSRKFQAADSARKHFRVEIEELKRRTRCRRCNKLGHWARECRSPPTSSSSASSTRPSSSSTSTADVNLAEHDVLLAVVPEGEQPPEDELHEHQITFVGSVEEICLQASTGDAQPGLVSSPGFGVIDSGCGRTLIGKSTLERMTEQLKSRTKRLPEKYQAQSVFRFGNGETESTSTAVRLPVSIGGQVGIIDAAVIKGRAPLLLGRPTLERLRVRLDFSNKTMALLGRDEPVPMAPNEAGQLLVNVMDFPKAPERSSSIRKSPASQPPAQDSPHVTDRESACEQSACEQKPDPKNPDNFKIPDPPQVYGQSRPVSSRQPSPVMSPEALPCQAFSAESRCHECCHTHAKPALLKVKSQRKIRTQVDQLLAKPVQEERIAVAELFSPPRFTTQARACGLTGIAFDKELGCDLLDPKTQMEVEELLEHARPDLLTASPPCTHWGGWDMLNRCYRTALQQATLVREARRQVRFCVAQIHAQLRRGGDFLFEHPLGSRVWQFPEVRSLVRKYGLHKVHMCAYGLCCKLSDLPIRKSTGLLCSNPDIVKALKLCPGCPKHQPLEGANRTQTAAAYTPEFVRILWRHVGPKCSESLVVEGETLDFGALQCECLAASSSKNPASSARSDAEAPPEPVEARDANTAPEGSGDPDKSPEQVAREGQVDRALKKLHSNLGHPSNKELVRLLKHSNASQMAIDRAQNFQCPVCANQQRPAVALPANASACHEFNEQVGLDVKYVDGWKQGQKVPCVNIVDFATSLQVMIPLTKTETGESLVAALRDRWVAWAGPPQRLILDPSQPNLSETMGTYCNSAGIDLSYTAAESSWQLGKVERHGQWFARIFQRVADECRPSDEADFLSCVQQTQSAKNSLLTEAGASPYQLVFGRNPRVPTDLMQEQPHLPAIDSAMMDPLPARTHAIRMAARKSMLECQDDRALKAALRARPRATRNFRSGDWVYYWRTQKYIAGTRIEGGRWYGAALVLGSLGRNLVVAHRRSILRCSPEQLRFATSEEATMAEFPEAELLGIRNLLEKGQFPKGQFVDLLAESKPPEPEARQSEPVSGAPLNAAQCLEEQRQRQTFQPQPAESRPESGVPYETQPSISSDAPQTYGPVRTRVLRKTNPKWCCCDPLLRRNRMLAQMPGVVSSSASAPVSNPSSGAADPSPPSPRPDAFKREVSVSADAEEPSSARPRLHTDEALWITEVPAYLSHGAAIEVMMASFLQKRAQKEIPACNNEPALQSRVDDAKSLE